jgi:hypothetical protein
MAPTSSDAGWDIPEDDPHHQGWLASDTKLVTTLHAMSCGWLSVDRGIEVSIKVHSDLSDSVEEHPACRSLVSIGCLSVPDLLSFLCHSAVGTSGGSYASFGPRRGAYSFIVSREYASCRLERGLGNQLI